MVVAGVHLASREIRSGNLQLDQDVIVADESGKAIASFPIAQFIRTD